MSKKFRVFATCDIGESIDLLRKRGYEVEVYPAPEAPPKSLILDKARSGVDGLITTLRDEIDAEVFEAGQGHLKVVAQFAVGFDNINRADANRYKVPFTHTADVLTEATSEFAFFMMGALAWRVSSVITESPDLYGMPVITGAIGVKDRFGESGAPWELIKEFEVSAEHIAKKALELMQVKRTGVAETHEHVFAGLGIGMTAARDAVVTGVCKSFQTRVGSGPFPSEVFDELAIHLRGTGENPWDEYGTTTGRARRVGWLDGVLLRYAVRINGLTELVITKVDVLSGFESLRLCTAYRSGGKLFTDLPFGPSHLEPYEPIYEELPGWADDVTGIRNWNDLPREAKNYLDRISQLAGVPIRLVSVGPERGQIVVKP